MYNDIRQGGPLSENGATASPNGGGKKKAQNRVRRDIIHEEKKQS